MDLSLEEKTKYAALRAKEIAAEKHFFDAAQPFFPMGFSVYNRDKGHWDISAKKCPGKASAFMHANPEGFTSATDNAPERAFRIRGEHGNVIVFDERWDPFRPHPREHMTFKSVTGAMLWIIEEMMQEPESK
jgi:hypothetical protein